MLDLLQLFVMILSMIFKWPISWKQLTIPLPANPKQNVLEIAVDSNNEGEYVMTCILMIQGLTYLF